MNQEVSRPDLSGEVRFRVPLIFAIPFVALIVIGGLAFGFSRVLLSVESKEAATTIAIVMAANILAACAYLALRPRVQRASVVELILVALYPVIVGIALAVTGVLGGEAEPAEPPPQGAPAPAGPAGSIAASGTNWTTNTLELPADGATLPVENQDATVHNLSIYPDEDAALAKQDVLFTGPDVPGGQTVDYEVDPQKPGTYTFICDYHSNMIGDITFQ